MIRTPTIGHGPFGGPVAQTVRDLLDLLAAPDTAEGKPLDLDEKTISIAVAEGLGPILGARVSSQILTVPEHRRESLLWEHQVCIGANLVRQRALGELAGVYAAARIPIVLLKGMAVIQETLNAGERSMADIDVLVPPTRWREACGFARAAGYEPEALHDRTYTAEHDYVRSFTTPGGVVIEVHRFVAEQTMFAVDYEGVDGLFARSKQVSAGIFLPEPGDLLLTLAAHAAKHTFDLPLRSYLDGLILMRLFDLSVTAVIPRARSWRMERAFRLWVRALQKLSPTAEAGFASGEHGLREEWTCRVWARTSHQSPWQRFVRMAWLLDGRRTWARHVATRALFRAIDAAQSAMRSRDCAVDRRGKGQQE